MATISVINDLGFVSYNEPNSSRSTVAINIPTTINSPVTITNTFRLSGSLSITGSVDGIMLQVSSSLGSVIIPTKTNFLMLADATSGSMTYTLPDASNFNGSTFFIKKIDRTTNSLTIAASGSQVIDYESSVIINSMASVQLVNYNSKWWII